MFPALMAAQPLIRYGVLIGVPVLLAGLLFGWGYVKGRADMKATWDAAIAEQAQENAKHVVQAEAMEAQVIRKTDGQERQIQEQVRQIEKEARPHVTRKPISRTVERVYDRLVELSNEAGRGVSSPDPGSGKPEVSRGTVAAETAARVSVPAEDGASVELTTEELLQAAVDFAEKYALLKNAYQGFSTWNDGREALELSRLNQGSHE